MAAEDLKTLAPTKAVGFYLAGIAAQSEKRDADAQASFEKALQLQPDAADALAALARLHVTTGHPERARAAVEQALARRPDNFVARNLLGELQLANKEFGPAQQEFTKVIAAAPEWPLGWRNLALAQLAANDRAGAVATLEKGVPKTNWDFTLVADLAALYERNQEFDKAISSYEALVAKRARRRGGREQSRHAARDLSQGPEEPGPRARAHGAVRQLAECRVARYPWLGALSPRPVCRSAGGAGARHQIAPQALVVRFHLGMAQFKSGQSAQARENLQAALQSKSVFAGADEARAALASIPSKG